MTVINDAIVTRKRYCSCTRTVATHSFLNWFSATIQSHMCILLKIYSRTSEQRALSDQCDLSFVERFSSSWRYKMY